MREVPGLPSYRSNPALQQIGEVERELTAGGCTEQDAADALGIIVANAGGEYLPSADACVPQGKANEF